MDEMRFEAFESAVHYIGRIQSGVPKIVESFQSGREDLGANMMIDLIGGIQWMVNLVTLTNEHLKVEETKVECLNTTLSQLNIAYENLDYVLIGDVLEYELLPVIDSLKPYFEKAMGAEIDA